MRNYREPIGCGGTLLILFTLLMIIVAPPIGLFLSLALAFWKD